MERQLDPGRRRGVRRAFGYGLSRRLRVAPWQGSPEVALVGPLRTGRPPTTAEISRCVNALRSDGVSRIVTPALNPFEAEPFFQAGFGLLERLHLLSCSLSQAAPGAPEGPASLSAGRPWHEQAVLSVDGRAFTGFWRFDKLALKEARAATPSRRFRVARIDGRIVGYAVTGRAGQRGYLQRLAVDPDVQGSGIGTMLVKDSFQWLRQKGSSEALVNTQESNESALALYERLGYRRQQQGLLVLRWDEER